MPFIQIRKFNCFQNGFDRNKRHFYTEITREKQHCSSYLDPSLITTHHSTFTGRENIRVDTRKEDTDAGTTQEVAGSGSKHNGKLRRQPVDIKAVHCSCLKVEMRAVLAWREIVRDEW